MSVSVMSVVPSPEVLSRCFEAKRRRKGPGGRSATRFFSESNEAGSTKSVPSRSSASSRRRAPTNYSHARCAAIVEVLLPAFRFSHEKPPDDGGWTLSMWAWSYRRSMAPWAAAFSVHRKDPAYKVFRRRASEVLRACREDRAYIAMLALNALRSPQAWSLFYSVEHGVDPEPKVASRPFPRPWWPIEAVDEQGRNVLHMAVERCQPDFVTFLLNEGAPVVPDTQGVTPLHLVMTRKEKPVWQSDGVDDIIQALFDRGVSASCRDKEGRTPLHWAVVAVGRRPSVIKKLLSEGADAMAYDNEGFTPLDKAAAAGYDGLVSLLLCRVLEKLHIKSGRLSKLTRCSL